MTNEPEQTPEMTGEASEHQIVKAANEWMHPLVPYGASKALKEMTRRIMALDRNEIRMTAPEAAHLAQVAAASQLNPFMDEVWGWVTLKGNARHFSIMPGRRGLLRHAHAQAKARNTHFWPEYSEIEDAERRKTLGIPEGAMAFECHLKDHLAVTTWVTAVNTCKDAGYTPDEIRRECGSMPYTYGLGILTAQEMATLDKSGRNRMSHVERCQKRAYMMALKQAFDLPLGGSVGASGETVDDYIPEGQWRDVTEAVANSEPIEIPDALKNAPQEVVNRYLQVVQDGADINGFLASLSPEERGERAKKGREALYGKDEADPKPIREGAEQKPQARSWSAEICDKLRTTELFPEDTASKRIVNTLNLSPFSEGDPFKWILEWLGLYKVLRAEGNEGKVAAPMATARFCKAHLKDKDAEARFGAKALAAWAKE